VSDRLFASIVPEGVGRGLTDYEALSLLLEARAIGRCEVSRDAYDRREITVEADGYNGFFTVFKFDSDGKLTSMGAWE